MFVAGNFGLWKTKWMRDMTKGKEIDPITMTTSRIMRISARDMGAQHTN